MKRGGVSFEKWIKVQISEHRGRRKRAMLSYLREGEDDEEQKLQPEQTMIIGRFNKCSYFSNIQNFFSPTQAGTSTSVQRRHHRSVIVFV